MPGKMRQNTAVAGDPRSWQGDSTSLEQDTAALGST